MLSNIMMLIQLCSYDKVNLVKLHLPITTFPSQSYFNQSKVRAHFKQSNVDQMFKQSSVDQMALY